MNKLNLWVLGALMSSGIAASQAADFYAVGAFNDWNIHEVSRFELKDGMYELEITFGESDNARDFKLSTVEPVSDGLSEAWNEFDAGALTVNMGAATTTNTWYNLAEYTTQQKPNMRCPAAGKVTMQIDADNMRMRYVSDVPAQTPWSQTLPVLFINTDNNEPVTSKETYLTGTYYLDPMGVDGVEAVGSAEAPLTLQIKGRGNYTWTGFEKKPYRLKFEKKAAILGMKKSKHFALLAHADDNLGFMRNALGFEVSRLMGMPWTPQAEPCEVVLNGDYIGLYFLTETIRVDADRVNVIEQEDLATTDVDGGWLVEIDNYDTDPHVTVNENGGWPIWFTYKSPEVLSNEQESYLQTQMQAVDDAVYRNGYAALSSLVDMDVLARFYITQQVMGDEESFHGSCYLNRQRGEAEKWKFGPVWDFGNAFVNGDSPRFIFEDPMFSQVWIGQIYSYPEFVEVVKARWADFLVSGPEAVNSFIDNESARIAVAAEFNYRRWPQYGNANVPENAAKAKRYVNASIDWLKERWGSTPAGVENVAVEANNGVEAIYDLNGVKVEGDLAPGIYVRIAGGKAAKVLVK